MPVLWVCLEDTQPKALAAMSGTIYTVHSVSPILIVIILIIRMYYEPLGAR